MIELIDTHCHLDFAQFDEDRDALLAELPTKGVSAIVNPSVNAQNWQRVIELAAKHDNIHAALGLHPCFLDEAKPADLRTLSQLVETHKPVAIGECGLDFTLDNHDVQHYFFTAQLTLAKQHDLPVLLHHRKSHDIILKALRQYKLPKGGIIHAFSGSHQQAMQYVDLGFKLGIGGTITYDRAEKTREAISNVPLEALVLETDAPDMPIYGRQGSRNSPIYIGEIFTVLGMLLEVDQPTLAAQLRENTRSVLGV